MYKYIKTVLQKHTNTNTEVFCRGQGAEAKSVIKLNIIMFDVNCAVSQYIPTNGYIDQIVKFAVMHAQ